MRCQSFPLDGRGHHNDGGAGGCMRGVIRFLDVQHRLLLRNVIAHRKLRDARHHCGNSPKMKPDSEANVEELDVSETIACPHMEGHSNAKKTSSGKGRLQNIFKKRRKDKDQRRKPTPLASQLLRTTSIHNSQSNCCGVSGHLLPSENSGFRVSEIDSPRSTEHVQLLNEASTDPLHEEHCQMCGAMKTTGNSIEDGDQRLEQLESLLLEKQQVLKEKLSEAKDALMNQNSASSGACHLSRDLLDMMEQLNSNRELLLELLQDPNFMLEGYIWDTHPSRSEASFARSYSLPEARLSDRKRSRLCWLKPKRMGREFSAIWHKGKKAIARNQEKLGSNAPLDLASRHDIGSVDTEAELPPGSEVDLRRQRSAKSALSRFKDIRKRIKDVVKENKKELHRISMDGVLHKVPYGHKAPSGEKGGIRSEPYGCNAGNTPSIAAPNGHNAEKRLRRTPSLMESLDRYSHLIELTPIGGSEGLGEGSAPMAEDGHMQGSRKWAHDRNASLSMKMSPRFSLFDDDDEEKGVVGFPDRGGTDPKEIHSENVDVEADEMVLDNEQQHLHFEEVEDEHVGIGTEVSLEASAMEDDERGSELVGMDTLQIQVDISNQAEFEYVRGVLQRSRFNAEEFMEGRCSHNQAELAEFSPQELEKAALDLEADMSLAEQLLFDLINEVLLEMYGSSFACGTPWPLYSCLRPRPMPVGYHLLEEVWANISRHLRPLPDEAVEAIVARDFARNDGWMDLLHETEEVGMDLEDLIMDDLLQDAIFNQLDFLEIPA